MKKLLAALLCCAMLLSAMPVAVAENGTEEPIEAVETAVEVGEADLTEEPVEEYAAEESEEAEATEEAPVVEEVLPEAAEDEDEVEALPEEEAETAEAVVEVAEEAVEAAEEAPEVALEAAFDEPVPEEQVIENAEAEAEIAANSLPAEGIPIDETNFPDSVFRDYVLEEIDRDGNWVLSNTEIRNTLGIFVESYVDEEFDDSAVRSLKGIEYFTYLVDLSVSNTLLTEVDLSQNTKLESLDLANGKLTSLNISNNKELRSLSVNYNRLESLDTSANTELQQLEVCSNQLTSLNLSANTLLEMLDCSDNLLESLDVSMCPILKMIITKGAFMGSDDPADPVVEYHLVISEDEDGGGTVLTVTLDKSVTVECGDVSDEDDVPIDAENFPDKHLREYLNYLFDVDHDGKMSKAECLRVTELNYMCGIRTSIKGIEHFTNLKYIEISSSSITSIDLSNHPKLSEIWIDDNSKLETLILGDKPKLKHLSLNNNALTSIDLSGVPALEELDVHDNKLTTLDVGDKPGLLHLDAGYNRLTSLTMGTYPALETLNVSHNKLTTLNVRDLTALKYLYVQNNQLIELDVSQNVALRDLDVSGNKLTHLDVSNDTKLRYLDCENTSIKTVDVSKCKSLVTALTKGQVSTSGNYIECYYNSSDITFPVGAKITYGTRVMKSMAVSKSTSASLYISDRLALKAAAGRIKKITAISNKKVVTAKLYDGALTINGKAHGKSAVTFTTVRPKTQFSDGYFMQKIQNEAINRPKLREKRGVSPQNSAIFLIFGIAILR